MLSGAVNHLHIVMNDPVFHPESDYEAVLLVNISTVKPNNRFDDACLIEPGEHPFVKVQSHVCYADAVIKSAEDLTQFVAIGEIIPKDDVSEVIYDRVLAGFGISRRVTPKIKRFVKQHLLSERDGS